MKKTIKLEDNPKVQKLLPVLKEIFKKKDLVQSDVKSKTEEDSVETTKEDSPILDCGWI